MENLALDFWKNKKVFITGHTGFKGSWLSKVLINLGAEIYGVSLPTTEKNLIFESSIRKNCKESFFGDINDDSFLKSAMNVSNPEIIFHLAAQPLVIASYKDPIQTFSTNILGTAKVLFYASNLTSLKAIVNITSDKCYKNDFSNSESFVESDPMGGIDPYSASKGSAELISYSMYESFLIEKNIGVANVRAGNVIGGGDFSENRLLPDIVKSINNNKELVIRSPNAIRPWQHVLEPIFGYIELAQKLSENQQFYSGGWNFGPHSSDCITVERVLSIVNNTIPDFKYMVDTNKQLYEARTLKLNISKALHHLEWTPVWDAEKAIIKTLDFNTRHVNKENIGLIISNQIEEYITGRNEYKK